MTALVALVCLLSTQEGAFDVLDGETLYEDGWLFTTGYGVDLKNHLQKGRDRISNPLDERQIDQTVDVSAHYGFRHDLQLSVIVPYVHRALEVDDPVGPNRFSAEGIGDVTLAAKWRYHRESGEGWSNNFAILFGADAPTGSDDARDHGVRLPSDLQPGVGGWAPFLGTGMTYEPERWRFNAFALYKYNSEGHHDYKRGDQAFAELAAGNRFWLEPYPGPFMRLDLLLRYRHQAADRDSGDPVPNTAEDRLTTGFNWAFRPRPTIDIQVSVEVPIWQNERGIQLAEDVSIFVAFGFRI